jgi:hypothetical protein
LEAYLGPCPVVFAAAEALDIRGDPLRQLMLVEECRLQNLEMLLESSLEKAEAEPRDIEH